MKKTKALTARPVTESALNPGANWICLRRDTAINRSSEQGKSSTTNSSLTQFRTPRAEEPHQWEESEFDS